MTKKINENSPQCILSLSVKSTTFSCTILLNLIKIGELLVKNSEKSWMKSTEFTLFSRKFKPRYLPIKNENQKNFLIPYSTLDKLSNDTSLNSLRWIYRSAKIDWTKKTQLSIYFLPAQEGSEQLELLRTFLWSPCFWYQLGLRSSFPKWLFAIDHRGK